MSLQTQSRKYATDTNVPDPEMHEQSCEPRCLDADYTHTRGYGNSAYEAEQGPAQRRAEADSSLGGARAHRPRAWAASGPSGHLRGDLSTPASPRPSARQPLLTAQPQDCSQSLLPQSLPLHSSCPQVHTYRSSLLAYKVPAPLLSSARRPAPSSPTLPPNSPAPCLPPYPSVHLSHLAFAHCPPLPSGPAPAPQSRSSSSPGPVSPQAWPPRPRLLPRQLWPSAFSLGGPRLQAFPPHTLRGHIVGALALLQGAWGLRGPGRRLLSLLRLSRSRVPLCLWPEPLPPIPTALSSQGQDPDTETTGAVTGEGCGPVRGRQNWGVEPAPFPASRIFSQP